MYKSIIFDFFDVIRTDPYKAWLKQHNIKREGDYANVSNDLDRGHIDLATFHERLHTLSGHPIAGLEHAYANTMALDTGTTEFIKNLRKNYRIGLLSNAPSAYLHDLLEKHQLKQLFDVVVISSETGLIKPSPEAFHYILQRLNTKPQDAIFIDDYDYNVAAAKSVGITALQYKDLTKLRHDLASQGIRLK